MAAPPPYQRATSFTDWSAEHPGEPQRGQDLDQEFDALDASLTATQVNLGLIQREDGELGNETVGRDQLKDELIPQLAEELDVIGPEGPPGPAIPGPAGLVGPQGPALPWLLGNGVPTAEIGLFEQLYLNVDNGDVYAKGAFDWALYGSIRGPQGVPGDGGGVTDHGALTGLADADHPISAVSGLQTSLNNLQAAIVAAQAAGLRIYAQASQPTPPNNVGDLWFDTDAGNKLYRWNGDSWVDVVDARVATASAQAAAAITAAATAQATADGKVATFYAADAPTAEGVGDLWIDTDTKILHRWNGAAWEIVRDQGITQALTDAELAQATADGKIQTFYQTAAPAGAGIGVGDLWIDTDDKRRPYRWSGTQWIDITPIDGVVGGQVGPSGIQSGAVMQVLYYANPSSVDCNKTFANKTALANSSNLDFTTSQAAEGATLQTVIVSLTALYSNSWVAGSFHEDVPFGPAFRLRAEIYNVTDGAIVASDDSWDIGTLNLGSYTLPGGHPIPATIKQLLSWQTRLMFTPPATSKTYRVRVYCWTVQSTTDVNNFYVGEYSITALRARR